MRIRIGKRFSFPARNASAPYGRVPLCVLHNSKATRFGNVGFPEPGSPVSTTFRLVSARWISTRRCSAASAPTLSDSSQLFSAPPAPGPPHRASSWLASVFSGM
jgi:hypothetical protein